MNQICVAAMTDSTLMEMTRDSILLISSVLSAKDSRGLTLHTQEEDSTCLA